MAQIQDTIKVVDGRLLIDVALANIKVAPLSVSGKNRVLFSTHGNKNVDGVMVGINVYTKEG